VGNWLDDARYETARARSAAIVVPDDLPDDRWPEPDDPLWAGEPEPGARPTDEDVPADDY